MDVIEKSPYEPNFNAEKGVKIFEDMRVLLQENNEDDRQQSVSPQAKKIFGPSMAWCLVKANALIDKSGMTYSQDWVNGNIRGNQIGKIPPELLILCFVANRFEKANDMLLSGIARDLQVSNLVKEALKEWDLEFDYKDVMDSPTNFQFKTKKRDCYKCAIFVARLFSCYKAFNLKGDLEPALLKKVKACLDIMEVHLPNSTLAVASNKRKQSVESSLYGPATSPMPSPEKKTKLVDAGMDDDQPPETPDTATKRKPGRPKKSPEAAVAAVKPKDSIDDASSLQSDDSSLIPLSLVKKKSAKSPRSKVASKKMPPPQRRMSEENSQEQRSSVAKKLPNHQNHHPNNNNYGTTNEKKTSFAKLVAEFEGQYEEMGATYKRMGDTLSKLNVQLDENRNPTAKEIREEIYQEVQENIMKTFSKN